MGQDGFSGGRLELCIPSVMRQVEGGRPRRTAGGSESIAKHPIQCYDPTIPCPKRSSALAALRETFACKKHAISVQSSHFSPVTDSLNAGRVMPSPSFTRLPGRNLTTTPQTNPTPIYSQFPDSRTATMLQSATMLFITRIWSVLVRRLLPSPVQSR
jgi:hypothetical protein